MPPTRPPAPFTFICTSCLRHTRPQLRRTFATTPSLRADDPPPSTPAPLDSATSALAGLSRSMNVNRGSHPRNRPSQGQGAAAYMDLLSQDPASLLNDTYARGRSVADEPPHRLHIYAHKHNTHITFSQPPRKASDTAGALRLAGKTSTKDQNKIVDVVLALSAGNIGFKKAARGSYDAAFQLIAFILKQIQEKGMLRDISKMEVVLRGFGAGREAVTKALLGTEGRHVRGKIVSVVDATRLKQGGPRSKKPRRLG